MKRQYANAGSVLLFIALHLLNIHSMAAAIDKENLDKLTQGIQAVKQEFDVPLVSAIIVSRDKVIWSDTMGVMDRDTNIPANKKTIFRIGSITKMFTGMAMAMLEEEGIWELDQQVKYYKPDFPYSNKWENTHPVLVKHLIEHTSGLTGLTWEEFRHPEPMSLKDAIMWKAADRQTSYPPGLHKLYSNAGPGYAAYLFEHVSGEHYEDFVQKRIFSPLDMQSAGFFPDNETLASLPTGYDRDGHTSIPYWHMIYRAFGAINATTEEMGRFIQLMLNHGHYNGTQLVRPETIQRMETATSTLAAKDGLEFGYGLGIYSYLRKGHLFYGHGGDADGYLSRLGYNREHKLGYFLVINVFDHTPLTRMRHLLEDFMINNETRTPPPAFQVNIETLKEYTGHYEVVAARFLDRDQEPRTATIAIEEGNLLIDTGKKQSHLYPVTGNHFRYRDETVATSAFVDFEGELYFQDFNVSYRKITNIDPE